MIGLGGELDLLSIRPDILSTLARRHRVPGAQLAIHHDGRTLAFEVGEREIRTGRRVTRDTGFPVGSITKVFTAILAMILVADGDIDLDVPVGDYLPELDDDLAALLTLRQVLSHTSGLASDPESDDLVNPTARRYVIDHCRRSNLVLAPGTGFSYSNMGYVLVGQLIEAATGMSWQEAVESILLRPLNIEPAFVGNRANERAKRPIATGHSVNAVAGGTRPVRPSLAPAEASTAALAVSAADLVSLGLLHVGSGSPAVLPAAYAEQMRQPIPAAQPFGLAHGWGLGLALFRHADTEWVGHDGNFDGTSCYLRIDPAGGRVIAFTSNANTGSVMWQDLLAQLASAGIPIAPAPAIASPQRRPIPPPAGCTGTYTNGDVQFDVTAREGGLYLEADGNLAALTLYEDLTFAVREPSSGRMVPGGRFVPDPVTRRFDGIQIGGRLACRRAHDIREPGRQLIA